MSSHSHSHQHQHQHHHHRGYDIAAQKEHFDNPEHAQENFPHIRDVAARVAKGIIKTYDKLEKEKTVAMDFACGNGFVSKGLMPFVKSILGIDISPVVVEKYNASLKGEGASAVCMELKGEKGELEDAQFDLIFCTAGYHHLESYEEMTRILTSFLKPGGDLIVADLLRKEDRSLFPATFEHVAPHAHGLSKDDIQRAFDGASLTMRSFNMLPPADYEFPDIFIAIGEKPSV
ncbi:hypothetical protein AGABI1DRAFT_104886 [Agaricus bisporus var. burnettii JB137-S8]|uniref:Methyltransferase type 11 domain-containing protein n=2 Tax=Agaricus bisporus var. burnettii TaxID=192524 RepID=K5X5M8_AGABU|nr:uncharacterized protein AGABI1DRAFT_104886 [Agaricus bisporus var. burnettii JB137-S8]EKM83151.1 hypothetical protein AGABI1DRAFT_104886 [Agaricus bisporus var. burnettii JB137-S8]KAF7777642.1 hypothetical protein Agabi119p4_3714 [Agaricus bisporus var. burnettii]